MINTGKRTVYYYYYYYYHHHYHYYYVLPTRANVFVQLGSDYQPTIFTAHYRISKCPVFISYFNRFHSSVSNCLCLISTYSNFMNVRGQRHSGYGLAVPSCTDYTARAHKTLLFLPRYSVNKRYKVAHCHTKPWASERHIASVNTKITAMDICHAILILRTHAADFIQPSNRSIPICTSINNTSHNSGKTPWQM
jgi:hypothetical protein